MLKSLINREGGATESSTTTSSSSVESKIRALLKSHPNTNNVDNAILLSLHSTVVDVRDALLASSHRDELFVDGWSFKVAADFEDEEETKNMAAEDRAKQEEEEKKARIAMLEREQDGDPDINSIIVTSSNAIELMTDAGDPECTGGLLQMPIGWRVQTRGGGGGTFDGNIKSIRYISPEGDKVCKTLKQVAEFLDIQRVTDSKRTKHSDAERERDIEPILKFSHFKNTSSLWWMLTDLKMATLAAQTGGVRKRASGGRGGDSSSSSSSSSGGRKKRKN